MAIRVILADDHNILRAGLKGLLRPDAEFEVFAEADNGRETVNLVLKQFETWTGKSARQVIGMRGRSR